MTLATVEQARDTIVKAARPLGSVETPLDRADGLWLAETVFAARDQPPFDASGMDGWAMRACDVRPGARLAIVGESAAGHAPGATVGPGQAVRIFTGAGLPDGAERVVIQEEARRDGDVLILATSLSEATWVRPRGGDFRQGEALLRSGVRLNPWRVSLAAAAGRASLVCARPPRVAILPTGDEVVPSGEDAGPLQIFDSAGPGLLALVGRWGGIPVLRRPVGDDEGALSQALAGNDYDLLVTVGGASVGDHDLVKPVARSHGAELRVDGVAVRPGRPLWFGVFPDGRLVLGLPGNPVSALVCAELFLSPLLAALQGGTAPVMFETATLVGALEANGPREHYLRASLVRGTTSLEVSPAHAQDSSLVRMLANSDALIRRAPFAPAVADGDPVEILSGPPHRGNDG